MKPNERRTAFLAGILTNVWNTLNHAIGLVDHESAKLYGFDDPTARTLIHKAFDAVEKAKEHLQHKMDEMTDWNEEKEVEETYSKDQP